MKEIKLLIAFVFILFFEYQVEAFDVGGLVSDGNGGYSDVGFGGFQGSGDLGLSDGDLGDGFGVSDSGSSDSSEGYGGGLDGGYDGGYDGGNTGSSSGPSSNTPQDNVDIPDNLRDQIQSLLDKLNSPQVEEEPTTLLRSPEITPDAMQDMIDSFDDVDNGNTGLFWFHGAFTELNMNEFQIHTDSDKLVNRLVKAFKNGPLQCPMSRLGLLGARIVVIRGLKGSFYYPKTDTIFLSKANIDKYGVAVLYHELLHAGLIKAETSNLMSLKDYEFLANLNLNKFSHLNGTVGTSHGHYEEGGSGYHEAFILGWTYVKISSKLKKIADSENGLVAKAVRFRSDLLNNVVIKRLANGERIRMIHSENLTTAEIKQGFLKRFTNKESLLRNKINSTQTNIKRELPNLCAPGTVVKVGTLYCDNSEAIYARPYVRTYKVCDDNYRYGPERGSCGSIIGYKGP